MITKLYSNDEDAERKSIDIALELIKQQITLVSVIVGIAINFTEDHLSNRSILNFSFGDPNS